MVKDLLEELDPVVRRDILIDIYDEGNHLYKGKYSKILRNFLLRRLRYGLHVLKS